MGLMHEFAAPNLYEIEIAKWINWTNVSSFPLFYVTIVLSEQRSTRLAWLQKKTKKKQKCIWTKMQKKQNTPLVIIPFKKEIKFHLALGRQLSIHPKI